MIFKELHIRTPDVINTALPKLQHDLGAAVAFKMGFWQGRPLMVIRQHRRRDLEIGNKEIPYPWASVSQQPQIEDAALGFTIIDEAVDG